MPSLTWGARVGPSAVGPRCRVGRVAARWGELLTISHSSTHVPKLKAYSPSVFDAVVSKLLLLASTVSIEATMNFRRPETSPATIPGPPPSSSFPSPPRPEAPPLPPRGRWAAPEGPGSRRAGRPPRPRA